MNQQINVGTTYRSRHDLSSTHVTTCDFGNLVPIYWEELVPGDNFNIGNTTVFTRLAPMVAPTFGRIFGKVSWFFVPTRLIYKEYQTFFTGGSHGTATDNHPTLDVNALIRNLADHAGGTFEDLRDTFKLLSYLGYPVSQVRANRPEAYELIPQVPCVKNVLPIRAYNKIFWDYYRDQELIDESNEQRFVHDGSGPEDTTSSTFENEDWFHLHQKCFKKDYFTTAFLSPQRGNTSYVLTEAPNFTTLSEPQTLGGRALRYTSGGDLYGGTAGTANVYTKADSFGKFDIPQLMQVNSAYNWAVRNNVGGARYLEQALAHFGIAPSPVRMLRAEYITGGSFDVQIQDVTRMADDSVAISSSLYRNVNPAGTYVGKGYGSGQTRGDSYHAQEHGYLMCILSIEPETFYYNGTRRQLDHIYREDFFTPEFEQTGFQPLYNKELYEDALGESSDSYHPDGVFGYVPRYAEYKYHGNYVSGDMTFYESSMNALHLGRHLTDTQIVNDYKFKAITYSDGFTRIFQDTAQDADHFWVYCHCEVTADRPMLPFADPSLAGLTDEHSKKVSIPYGGIRL